ncbi:MAG: alpha/beta hydrolase [Clostridia bacterium]|nr:alpha/beta hydrolase [Clostridia bacterium]
MNKTKIPWIMTLAFIIVVTFYSVPLQKVIQIINYEFSPKKGFHIKLAKINEPITALCAEPSNKLHLLVSVWNGSGKPVPFANVSMKDSKAAGSFSKAAFRTDVNGECIVTYTPSSELNAKLLGAEGIDTELTASISGTDIKSSTALKLIRVPVVLVHGYQESSEVYGNMKEYLSSRGFESYAMDYKSTEGILSSSRELALFIDRQKSNLISRGIKASRLDIITHSMGGLVARLYTSSLDYITRNDVRKLIFVSVPHKGSPWASIGSTYFNDQGIRDLIPDNPLLSSILPSGLNKGLNSTLEIGNIVVEFDEVVSPESSSLKEWGIGTEAFNVGESNFSMEKLLNGNFMDAPNHKSILSNKKAFECIENMLNSKLPTPEARN